MPFLVLAKSLVSIEREVGRQEVGGGRWEGAERANWWSEAEVSFRGLVSDIIDNVNFQRCSPPDKPQTTDKHRMLTLASLTFNIKFLHTLTSYRLTPLSLLPPPSSSANMLLRTVLRPALSKSIPLSRPFSRSPLNRPVLIAFGLSISVPLLQSRSVVRLDTSPYSPSPQSQQSAEFSTSPYSHSKDAKTPLTKDGKTLNPAAVKQISLGALLGLGAGVLLSAFSRSLTLLLGLGIVIWQVGPGTI